MGYICKTTATDHCPKGKGIICCLSCTVKKCDLICDNHKKEKCGFRSENN